ncbi:MAG: phenylalanine--tRNA ligase subunit beta [Candidatus Improbicoccus pseudotrichonymphae]|uniref:Phenylalanine--tRNA ligase beta subunit n=1 Tax=Candidatus Improbicoccus pseudotrichonymphae TaxID=3033792 RepID=A0AA48KYS4_9FIRM|nr:MAG: phenylalanine--tRNA ligase subunit beta [Candidatus Improbicoccus pseudotrichonymphae]
MFKVSLNWLREIVQKKINRSVFVDEILSILNLQGFEIKLIEDFSDDKIITIEVKANRPDMLYHSGVAREIVSFLDFKYDDFSEFSFGENIEEKSDNFPAKIIVDNNVCKRYVAIVIRNINNRIEISSDIKKKLESIGVGSVNPVVDIQNYIMFEFGQPAHVYDFDKIKGKQLSVKAATGTFCFENLSGNKIKILPGDIIISDEEDIGCLAGIIGSKRLETDENTKNILIEAAIFDPINVRVTSRRTKVSTPSSFRFERGVSIERTKKICCIIAEKIIENCGGKITEGIYDYCEKIQPKKIDLDIQKCNSVVGTALSKSNIVNLLEKYDFKCENGINENNLIVTVPGFRLDVESEIDLIEETAKSFGYDNIKPDMPIFKSEFVKNSNFERNETIRSVLFGLGFNEIMTYSFIPDNTLSVLKIDNKHRLYSNIVLQNPISNSYALMRSTMVYSMLENLVYNYSIGNQDLALFELGRVYFEDKNTDTKCVERDILAMIFSGNRIEKGWGVDKNVKYNFYDLISFVNIIFEKFGIDFETKESDLQFILYNSRYELHVDNENIGFLGEVDKKIFAKLVPNVKLLKDSVFFCEFYTQHINESKKKLCFESKYPAIVRKYNFLVPENIKARNIIDVIIDKNNIVLDCCVKDLYRSDNMPLGFFSLLFEVVYRHKNRTLTSKEIETVEFSFLSKLKNNLKVSLKT